MKKNIVLFGASEYGKRVLESLKKDYTVIAFLDNDESKYGQKINGIEILSPKELSNLKYDYIYVTSMYALEITNQLIGELSVDKKVIKYIEMPKKKSFNMAPMIIIFIIAVVMLFLYNQF